MEILRYRDVVKEAAKEIAEYQSGKKKIIKTDREFLDNLFPVVNGSVIVISAGSGVGKSYELAKILNNILDTNLNPDAGNYVVLNISLEMRVRSLLLRALNKKLGKSKKDILLEEFSEEERALANEYFKSVNDNRQFISQVPTTPSKFYTATRDFLQQHKDKSTVFVGVDHLALIGADKGEGRNQIIESFIERVNDLKMEFENVVFILLSQTNSKMIERAKDKDVMAQPQDSDLYYSQFTFQVADYVIIITSPYKLGIKEYSKINPERYPNLEKYFLEPDSKGRVSLETFGVLYYHVLKCREADGLYLDIYAEDLHIPGLEEKRVKHKKEISVAPPPPTFDMTAVSFKSTAMEKVKGRGFDDSPF